MVFLSYVRWHYTVAPIGILTVSKNFIVGMWHRFLIPRHLMTLFSPWHRALPSQLPHKLNIGERVMYFIMDVFIRILGACIRMSVIVLGLLMELFLILGGVVSVVLWIIWPALVVITLYQGILLLTS